MAENADKITSFRDSVQKEIESEITTTITNAEQEKAAMIKQAQDDLLQYSFDTISVRTKQIKSDCDKKVSKASFDAKRAVLEKRSELVDSFFDGVSERLGEFSHSEKYGEYLKKCLSRVSESMPFYNGVKAYVASWDDGAVLEDEFPVLAVERTPSIKLGGISLYYPSEQKYVDETLDKKLLDEKKAFATKTELQL